MHAINHSALPFVGQRIRDLRVNSLRMTQAEFAFKVDMQLSYIIDVEKGMRNISLLSLIEMAKVLRVGVAELLPPI